jgi:hypothetical protein
MDLVLLVLQLDLRLVVALLHLQTPPTTFRALANQVKPTNPSTKRIMPNRFHK